MQKAAPLLGLLGSIALFFGATSYFLVGELETYSTLHLVLGVLLLALYFAFGFRQVGQLLRGRSTRYGANMIVSSILFLMLLAALNWLGVRHNERFDMTEAHVFTLSPQARQILDGLQTNLEMTAFVEAGHDPALESTLASFAQGSPLVSTEVIDPDQRPELAQRYDIRSYGTVRVQYRDQSSTVTQPNEETLTNAIIKVTRSRSETVYFLQGQGEPEIDDLASPSGYGQASADLQNEQYTVRPLLLLQEGVVPDDATLVAVAAPLRPLQAREIRALENFLNGGGRAIFLLPPQTGGELKPLLESFGVVLGDDIVVDEVVRLFQGPALGLEPMVETYGPHPITRDLRERTVFPMTRSVRTGEQREGLTLTSIAKTSPSSWADEDLEELFEQSTAERDDDEATGPISIGVAVTADLARLGRGEGEARLVVYGTAALADNQRINMLFNRDLFLNSFGWLADQGGLVSLRPRSLRNSRIQFSRQEAIALFYLSVLVLPELLLVIGLGVWWRRSGL